MNSDFRIDIDRTKRCADQLDELKRCAQQIVWRINDVKDLSVDERHRLIRCMERADGLARYFSVLSELLLDISDDALRTEQKIAALLEEALLPGGLLMQ